MIYTQGILSESTSAVLLSTWCALLLDAAWFIQQAMLCALGKFGSQEG